MHTDGRKKKALRGLLSAVCATYAALTLHTFAHGTTSIFCLFLAFVLSLLVCTLCSSQHRSLLRLTLASLVSQLFYHVLFSATMTTPHLANKGGGHAGHHSAVGSAQTDSIITSSSAHGGLPMFWGHIFAAAITVAILHYAENLCQAIAYLVDAVIAVIWVFFRVNIGGNFQAPPSSDVCPEEQAFLPLCADYPPLIQRGPPYFLKSTFSTTPC